MSKSPPFDPFSKREASRYESPIASRELILELLGKEPANFTDLIKQLRIKGQHSREALRRRLRAMERDGQLHCNRAGLYGVMDKMNFLDGAVRSTRDGYGFLLLRDAEDIFLNAREMRQVFDGDEVRVRLVQGATRSKTEGRIVEILQRNTTRVVGRYKYESDVAFIVPDNPRIMHDILLVDSDLEQLTIGEYVDVEIVEYPTRQSQAKGRIVSVLGQAMAPGLEIDIAVRSHDLPHEWPSEVETEMLDFHVEPAEKEKSHRVDLRHLPLVTIDGEDARDFDDAVYCEARKSGGFRLWVAIADVSHYVKVGSALDGEALRRGTSVYFPGRVVPMLPEVLSNGLCSLNPHVDRLCMVCEMTIGPKGRVTAYQFYEAVMHSHARLTYTEVAEALGMLAKKPRVGLLKRLQPLMPQLENLYELFDILKRARTKRGAIDFETTETQIVFNTDKKIDTIVPVERNDAHKIIEECMLAANVAAADFLSKHDLIGLYRVHQGPRNEKLVNLRAYLAELGLSLRGGETPQPKDYQRLMGDIEARPDASVIQTMMLRSLQQAVYAPENEGHFGLAYKAYAHFTSPIRRYPDLLVHRALRRVIRSRKQSDNVQRVRGAKAIAKEAIYPYSMADMLQIGEQCSMAERRADEATRDVMAWLKCEYLQEHIGESMSGVVTAVTNFGLFVELSELHVEGLVHISALGHDYFHFEQAKQRLIGERSRSVYTLGNELDVTVVAVDLDERKIDFVLADTGRSTKSGRRKGNSSKGKAIKANAKAKSKKRAAGSNKPKKTSGKKSKKRGVSKKNRKKH